MGNQPLPSWAILLAWCLAQRRPLGNDVGVRQLQCGKGGLLVVMVMLITHDYDGNAGRVTICGKQHMPKLISLAHSGGKIIYPIGGILLPSYNDASVLAPPVPPPPQPLLLLLSFKCSSNNIYLLYSH